MDNIIVIVTIGGKRKIELLKSILNRLNQDISFQAFINGETTQIPVFMTEKIKKDLGEWWYWLPNKSFRYEPNIISNVSVVNAT